MYCWSRKQFFYLRVQVRSALNPHALDGWHKENEGPHKLYIPTPVVLAYFSHRLLWISGTVQRLCDILWTTVASEMMLFTVWPGFGAAYYALHIYSRVLDPRLYRSLEHILGGGLGRLFWLPPTLFWSI